jgi:hypothetical protein
MNHLAPLGREPAVNRPLIVPGGPSPSTILRSVYHPL